MVLFNRERNSENTYFPWFLLGFDFPGKVTEKVEFWFKGWWNVNWPVVVAVEEIKWSSRKPWLTVELSDHAILLWRPSFTVSTYQSLTFHIFYDLFVCSFVRFMCLILGCRVVCNFFFSKFWFGICCSLFGCWENPSCYVFFPSHCFVSIKKRQFNLIGVQVVKL